MRFIFPPDYESATCYVVPINATLIPMVAGAMRFFEQPGSWMSWADYELGYNAIAELEVCMMRTCIDDLIVSNENIYRLLDAGLRGTIYTVTSTDPLVVIPAPAPAPDMSISTLPGLIRRMERIEHLVDNAINGTDHSPDYSYTPSVKELLQQLVDKAVGTGELDDEMLAQLVQIAGLLA